MSLKAIRNALNARLNTLPSLPSVAWENIAFTPKTTETHLPAANHKSAMDFESGIYQIDVYSPQDQGPNPASDVAESIRQHFSRGSTLVNSGITVNIEATPSMTLNDREGGFWRVRLTVPWFAYVPTS
jgi:hypothetical protein